MKDKVDLTFRIADLIAKEIIDARHTFGNKVDFDVHYPNRCISSRKTIEGEDIETVRVCFSVKGCSWIFVLEVFLYRDGFIDIVWGVINADDGDSHLSQSQKAHMYSKIKSAYWDTDDVELVNIGEYQEYQESNMIEPLDWEFLVRLDILTDDDQARYRNEDDYLDYDLEACTLCEFIDIFARENIADNGGELV